jgi:hypothetical protein
MFFCVLLALLPLALSTNHFPFFDRPICTGLGEQYNPAVLLYTPEGHQHLVSPRLDDRGLAPLTRWTQAYIHHNQFMHDCSERRVTVFHGWTGGFGSEMHVIGAYLAYAIEQNTTLVLSTRACQFMGCHAGCECMLAPISNCRFDKETRHIYHESDEVYRFRLIVPSLIKTELLARYPRMTEKQVLYWWRAQSSAFVARFNRETLHAVTALRHSQTSLPYPLPDGVIHAHIRGGDKHKEMKLIPAGLFVAAAFNLMDSMPNTYARHTLLITADDGEAVKTALSRGRAMGIEVIYSPIQRPKGGHDQLTWMNQDNKIPRLHENLLQLMLALEADAWLGTRGSNWNRLIDELRCVWVDKCLHPYVEVGDEPLGSYSW